MDKTTLGEAAVLGILCVAFSIAILSLHTDPFRRESAHLDATQFNWLGTIFYFSYLLFQYPQNLALQRFPVGKWMRYAQGQTSLPLYPILILPQASIFSCGQ
jgi:ACS family allantoate permease-like MFS transporter